MYRYVFPCYHYDRTCIVSCKMLLHCYNKYFIQSMIKIRICSTNLQKYSTAKDDLTFIDCNYTVLHMKNINNNLEINFICSIIFLLKNIIFNDAINTIF